MGRSIEQVADLACAAFGVTTAFACLTSPLPQGQEAGWPLEECDRAAWRWLARQERPMVIEDKGHIPGQAAALPRLRGFTTRFCASAPLIVRDEQRGALIILSAEPPAPGFSEDDHQRLQSLAGMLAAHWELRLRQEELAAQQQSLLAARRETDRIQARYQRLLRERDQVIQMMDHRVGNGLQMVNDALCLQALAVEDKELADRLAAAAGRIQAVADLHTRLRGQPMSRRISAGDYLGTLVDSFRRLLPGNARRVRADLGPSFMLSALDAPRLGMVVWELLSNAVRHGAGDVALSLQHDPVAGSLRVLVTDQGPGFRLPAEAARRNGENGQSGLALIRLIGGGEPVVVECGPPTTVSLTLDISLES